MKIKIKKVRVQILLICIMLFSAWLWKSGIWSEKVSNYSSFLAIERTDPHDGDGEDDEPIDPPNPLKDFLNSPLTIAFEVAIILIAFVSLFFSLFAVINFIATIGLKRSASNLLREIVKDRPWKNKSDKERERVKNES